MKGTGEYPSDWATIAERVKQDAGWRCVRCGHPHDIARRRVLTIHHLNLRKDDSAWFNLAPLCQACHLSIQGRVVLDRPWIFEHSEWFRPYVAGHYARKYLGVDLSREEVETRMDELLALESRAVIGRDPMELQP